MKRRQAGMTIVELIMALGVLAVGLVGVGVGFVEAARLTEQNRDNRFLLLVSHNVLSTLHSADFATLTTEFGPNSENANFWCQPDGSITFAETVNAFATGTIEFSDDESAPSLGLESLVTDLASQPASHLGDASSFDLNANGVIEGPVTDYKVLPTRVTLSINNTHRPRTIVFDFFLVDDDSG